MNLRHLRMLEAAARLGSLSSATHETLRSQSSLTYGIDSLERHFGCKLLFRGPHGCKATEAGMVVLRRAVKAFELIERAVQSAMGSGRERDGSNVARSVLFHEMAAATGLERVQIASTAAQALGLSESTLLRRVRDLEKLLNATLFERSDGKCVPVPQARGLLLNFGLAMDELRFAAAELLQSARPSDVVIRVGCAGPARTALMPRVVSAFVRQFPNATLRISNESFDRMQSRLMSGELDFVVGTERPDVEFRGLERLDLFDNSYVIGCRQGHPLAFQRRVSVEDLAGYGWILPMGGLPMRQAISAGFAKCGVKPHIALETPSITTSWAVMLETDYVMVVPRAAVKACRQENNVHVFPFPFAGDMGRVQMYWRDNVNLPYPQREFIKTVLRCAEALADETNYDQNCERQTEPLALAV